MEKHTLSEGDLFVSEQVLIEDPWNEDELDMKLEFILSNALDGRPLNKKYIELYGQLKKLKRIAALDAHGYSNGEWKLSEGSHGEIKRPVQDWIDENDGKYSALVLRVCNPGHHTPRSKRSILVVPDSIVGNFDPSTHELINDREDIYSLIVPKIGEVDSYTIEYEIEKLRKKL